MINKENRWFLTIYGIMGVGFFAIFRLGLCMGLDSGTITKNDYTYEFINFMEIVLLILGIGCFALYIMLEVIDIFRRENKDGK